MKASTILSGATLRSILFPANRGALVRACRRAITRPVGEAVSLERSLDAAYAWLCAAQDASPDGGVAGCYNLLKGWGGSYPETTGYIIPSFFHYSETRQSPEARRRALRMADWECEVQLPSGAVRSGMLGVQAAPAVFNTGQVLFGWVAAYAATGDMRYARSAVSAAEWLTGAQDDDGAWRKHLSVLTSSTVQAYNVRAAWGLALAGRELNESRWVQAAIRNCDWTLAQQAENGWFAFNAFSDAEDPLLHTIGYVLEGLLGAGQLLGRETYVRAAGKGARPLMEIYRRTGILRGRYDRRWNAAASWRCLTGEAQIALVLQRLANITGDAIYAETARLLLEGIARLQDAESPYPESRGAVFGSEPIWGGYGPFNYLNWAAKFFMDALMLQLYNVDVQEQPAGQRSQATA